ncbi:MAG TPA: hypothetical protein VFE24_07150, partial [Pirellulales bacterium]|nr:hypothetical protein [Pirellulales bacterium]
ADPREFIVGHGDDTAESARYYAYSWGVAYYLLIDAASVNAAKLESYVAADSDLSPDARFEKLCGAALAKFEPAWRARMLSLK